MSVGAITTTQNTLGYGSNIEDPREPVGLWFKEIAVTGDASGGAAELSISFGRNRLFSIEGMRTTNDGVEDVVEILWRPGWLATVELVWAQQLIVDPGGNFAGLVRGDILRQMPHSVAVGSSTVFPLLRAAFVNTDAINYALHAWGYYWTLQAMREAGGPRRPSSGR